MKILFLTNIPSPYRLDFFNKLGEKIDLKVVFEAEKIHSRNKKWYKNNINKFDAKFLKKGAIEEKKINWKILKYIKRENQDIIIVTNYSCFTELIALIYIKLKKIPYIMEVDGGIIRKQNILLRKFKHFLISGAKAYISPSKYTDDFLVYYGANREDIYRYPFTSLQRKDILNDVVSHEEKLNIRKKLNITEEKVVLSVGQFIHRKGYDILLNSCKSIPKNVGVYIVGGEPTEEYIRLKENLGLTNVNFVGFKTKEELKEYYKAADIFVLPTREDIWGLVINEAMAYSLPVITTDKCVAGIELISNNDNGFIVEVDNIEELSEKINIILKDKDMMKRMAKNNLEKIKKYTIENMAEENLRILEKFRR